MNFIADQQTLDDLNLLGKFRQHSIFSIFNKVHTSGGEKLLEEMFRNPFTDYEAINRRAAVFQYFQDNQTVQPENIGPGGELFELRRRRNLPWFANGFGAHESYAQLIAG